MAGVVRKEWGVLETGEEAGLYILRAGDLTATVSDYGATLVSLSVPARGCPPEDVILGCSTLAGFAASSSHYGSTVGRYANRIADARFSLGGKECRLVANDGPNHLHGGYRGFGRRMWAAEAGSEAGDPALMLRIASPDGEEGYPGRLEASVEFVLTGGGISIRYRAATDAPTPVNLTNHAYFNLSGGRAATILDHGMRLACSRYIPVDGTLIPSGGTEPVAGTRFDFREPRRIGDGFRDDGEGFDHCFEVDRQAPGLVEFAEVYEPLTGRRMRVATTMPGVQVYASGHFMNEAGKRGVKYARHAGLCLETQYFPDSPNRPGFPSCILEPGAAGSWETRYLFS